MRVTKEELRELFEPVVRGLRGYMDDRLKALPTPQNGKDADPDVVRAMVREEVAALPPPAPGKDADPLVLKTQFDAWLSAVPLPKDGADGKDADPEMMRAAVEAEVARAVAAIPPPKDGRDGKDAEQIHPDTLARLVAEEVAKAVGAMPRAKDGDPGKDAAQIDILPTIDPAKSYTRGTWAHYRNGTIRAFRSTDPIGEAGLEAAGWAVAMNGVAEEVEEILDEGRTIKRRTIYTDGRVLEREHHTALILFREFWRAGEYKRGDVVQLDGGIWYCRTERSDSKPGTSEDWLLMVKRGRDGRDRGADGSLIPPVVRTR